MAYILFLFAPSIKIQHFSKAFNFRGGPSIKISIYLLSLELADLSKKVPEIDLQTYFTTTTTRPKTINCKTLTKNTKMKKTHYKVKAAKAREDWNRLKEKETSEKDSKDKGKLQLDTIGGQPVAEKSSQKEKKTDNKSSDTKEPSPLRVAHTLSNAS